jgi:exopolyphosphatase/guanosine-5'-triphosphate,3'-diphosphate pyrophosphatase
VPSRIAILDLGTNTFHLLIADLANGIPEIVFRDRAAVKLGMGGINQDRITEDAQERALATLRLFQASIRLCRCDKTTAIGTSAIRCAVNGKEFARRVKSKLDIDIEVISGDREAELIFRGVCAAVDLDSSASLVMDIGGGSVEFILGRGSEILWKQSFEVGGQRLLEQFHRHDPIRPDELEELSRYLHSELAPLWSALQQFHPEGLVGVSGTFDTLSDIYCIRNGLPLDHDIAESPLTVQGFYEILQELVALNRSQRLRIPGMIEMRVDMIVVTSWLIRTVLEKWPMQSIRVSAYSLKEGVLYSYPHGESA